MVAGSPMFVAPWSSDFAKEEPQLTTAVIPVELRRVPYLLFNKQSLSRLTTAIGRPVSLDPETERKDSRWQGYGSVLVYWLICRTRLSLDFPMDVR